MPKNLELSCLSVYPPRTEQCLAHSRRLICSDNKGALLKEWYWLKHSQRKLVLLSWMCTYQCVNLFQDLHKLLDCGFYSPIEFAESFSLQILGQEALCRNNALLQYCQPRGWQKTWGQGTDEAATPWAHIRLIGWARPQTHNFISWRKEPPHALEWAAGHSSSHGPLRLLMPPGAWLWWSLQLPVYTHTQEADVKNAGCRLTGPDLNSDCHLQAWNLEQFLNLSEP